MGNSYINIYYNKFVKPRKYKHPIDYRKLYEMYVVRGFSSTEIAKMLNVSKSTVSKRLRDYRIPVRSYSEVQRGSKNSMYGKWVPRKVTKDAEWLGKEYVDKQRSAVDIAKELNCSYQAVIYALRKHSIKVRDSQYASNMRKKQLQKEGYYDTVDIPKKYLIEEYINKKRTMRSIANELGCNWDVVRGRIHRYGLPVNIQQKGFKGIRRRKTTDHRRFYKLVTKSYNYSCAVCGYDAFVNAHHIIPYSKGGDNSLNNGICLCPNHHAEADYGIISADSLRKYQLIHE